jgi:hypothetical protein
VIAWIKSTILRSRHALLPCDTKVLSPSIIVLNVSCMVDETVSVGAVCPDAAAQRSKELEKA